MRHHPFLRRFGTRGVDVTQPSVDAEGGERVLGGELEDVSAFMGDIKYIGCCGAYVGGSVNTWCPRAYRFLHSLTAGLEYGQDERLGHMKPLTHPEFAPLSFRAVLAVMAARLPEKELGRGDVHQTQPHTM